MSGKATLRLPLLFPEVLEAITDLQERGGSHLSNIKGYIKDSLKSGRCPTIIYKTLATQVCRVLKQAEREGILLQRNGKYKINTSIFSSRRRSNSQKKRKTRYRKPSTHRNDSVQTSSVGSESSFSENTASESSVPIREVRRSRRRSLKKREKRQKRHRAVKKRELPDRRKRNGRREDPGESKTTGFYECTNPECGCKFILEEL